MMEVTAQLRSRATFLSGEKLSCSITFTNVGGSRFPAAAPTGNQADLPDVTGLNGVQNLAWSSVQIQCLCQTSTDLASSLPSAPASTSDPGLPATSLKPLEGQGQSSGSFKTVELASTPPKILFCDLKLGPGESRAFLFEDAVPTGCPSTYHGRRIRYSYRLIVASQRINSPIATLKVSSTILHIGVHRWVRLG